MCVQQNEIVQLKNALREARRSESQSRSPLNLSPVSRSAGEHGTEHHVQWETNMENIHDDTVEHKTQVAAVDHLGETHTFNSGLGKWKDTK